MKNLTMELKKLDLLADELKEKLDQYDLELTQAGIKIAQLQNELQQTRNVLRAMATDYVVDHGAQALLEKYGLIATIT